jgi:hypothetical protein
MPFWKTSKILCDLTFNGRNVFDCVYLQGLLATCPLPAKSELNPMIGRKASQ